MYSQTVENWKVFSGVVTRKGGTREAISLARKLTASLYFRVKVVERESILFIAGVFGGGIFVTRRTITIYGGSSGGNSFEF